jgi:hypothetical protein
MATKPSWRLRDVDGVTVLRKEGGKKEGLLYGAQVDLICK